jgi:hypothetical protein
MPDFDSLEASGDMLSHEPPVTLGELVLGTEEADRSRLLEEGGILQGIPRGQEFLELPLILGPGDPLSFVAGEDFFRRCQFRVMLVDNADQIEDILQVVHLGIAGQLRSVVEADVDHLLNHGPPKLFDELPQVLLRKPDRAHDHQPFLL